MLLKFATPVGNICKITLVRWEIDAPVWSVYPTNSVSVDFARKFALSQHVLILCCKIYDVIDQYRPIYLLAEVESCPAADGISSCDPLSH